MKKPLFLIKALCAMLLMLPNMASAEKLRAVASFSIIGDIVKNVGGEQIEVKTLVGANQDAHVFEPSPNDAKAVAKANIVFVALTQNEWVNVG